MVEILKTSSPIFEVFQFLEDLKITKFQQSFLGSMSRINSYCVKRLSLISDTVKLEIDFVFYFIMYSLYLNLFL